jgi:hypothetical protein
LRVRRERAVGRRCVLGRVDQRAPYAVSSLATDLRALGLAVGDVVLLRCSQRVVQALLDVVI